MLSEAGVEKICRDLWLKYGRKAPDGLGSAWKQDLMDLSEGQIDHGLQNATGAFPKHPPNSREFAGLCRQLPANAGSAVCGNHGCPVPSHSGWCRYHQLAPHWQHVELSERLNNPEILRMVKFIILLSRMSPVERILGDQTTNGQPVWGWSDAFFRYWLKHPPLEYRPGEEPPGAIPLTAENGAAAVGDRIECYREAPDEYLARLEQQLERQLPPVRTAPAAAKPDPKANPNPNPSPMKEAFA